jgi:hypothetical protein
MCGKCAPQELLDRLPHIFLCRIEVDAIRRNG